MYKPAIYERTFSDGCVLRVFCKVDMESKKLVSVFDVKYSTKAKCVEQSVIIDDNRFTVGNRKSKTGFFYKSEPSHITLVEPDEPHIVTATLCQHWDGNVLMIPCYVDEKRNVMTIPWPPEYEMPRNCECQNEYIQFNDGTVNDAVDGTYDFYD